MELRQMAVYGLLGLGPMPGGLICFFTFYPLHSFSRQVLSSFYSWGDWGTTKLCQFPNIPKFVNASAKMPRCHLCVTLTWMLSWCQIGLELHPPLTGLLPTLMHSPSFLPPAMSPFPSPNCLILLLSQTSCNMSNPQWLIFVNNTNSSSIHHHPLGLFWFMCS